MESYKQLCCEETVEIARLMTALTKLTGLDRLPNR